MKTGWKEFTVEDWINAVFCDVCDLPLLETEPNENGVSGYMCVYCTWIEDETAIFNGKIAALQREVDRLKAKLFDILDRNEQTSKKGGEG